MEKILNVNGDVCIVNEVHFSEDSNYIIAKDFNGTIDELKNHDDEKTYHVKLNGYLTKHLTGYVFRDTSSGIEFIINTHDEKILSHIRIFEINDTLNEIKLYEKFTAFEDDVFKVGHPYMITDESYNLYNKPAILFSKTDVQMIFKYVKANGVEFEYIIGIDEYNDLSYHNRRYRFGTLLPGDSWY